MTTIPDSNEFSVFVDPILPPNVKAHPTGVLPLAQGGTQITRPVQVIMPVQDPFSPTMTTYIVFACAILSPVLQVIVAQHICDGTVMAAWMPVLQTLVATVFGILGTAEIVRKKKTTSGR